MTKADMLALAEKRLTKVITDEPVIPRRIRCELIEIRNSLAALRATKDREAGE